MGVLSLEYNRRTIRGPVNPMDKSTVVSIYPVDLDETKITLQPSNYKIPAGSIEKPSLLVVGSASWWREVDETQPLLEIPVSSVLVAESIVRDYANGLFMCDMDSRMPGLFFIMGEISLEKLKKEYQNQLLAAERKQKEWYRALVNQADVHWARTNGNPLSVSDLQRLAANELGMKDKPWMTNFIQPTSLQNCPACGALWNKQFPICQTCKTIVNPKQFEALGLKQAQ